MLALVQDRDLPSLLSSFLLVVISLAPALLLCGKKKENRPQLKEVALSTKSGQSTRMMLQSGDTPWAILEAVGPPSKEPVDTSSNELNKKGPTKDPANRDNVGTQETQTLTASTQLGTEESTSSSSSSSESGVELPPPPMTDKGRKAAKKMKRRTLKPVPRSRKKDLLADIEKADGTQRSLTPEIIDIVPTSVRSKSQRMGILRKTSTASLLKQDEDLSTHSESKRSIRFANDATPDFTHPTLPFNFPAEHF